MTNPASEPYHVPVLVAEVIEGLVTDPEGAYLDLTLGGGGHTAALASALSRDGRLYGVDRDPDALAAARKRLEGIGQVRQLVHATFGDILTAVTRFPDRLFSGVLLDLGVSSHQINDPHRGFTFQENGPLDMRMDPALKESAADLIHTASEKELTEIIRRFGEERHAARLARALVRERQKDMIRTTARLAEIVSQVITGPHRVKSLARVFQAFRIAVNRELDELRSVLPAAVSLLAPNGRIAVISYHSLEDRIVKRFFQEQSRSKDLYEGLPVPNKDVPGRLRLITRKPIEPTDAETAANPRARSAKLRIAEKV